MKQKFVSDSMVNGTEQAPGTFQATIKIDTSIDVPSEIHVFQSESNTSYWKKHPMDPYNWYKYGFDFTIIGHYEVQPEIKEMIRGNTVYMQVTNEEFNGQLLTFKITPKKKDKRGREH